MSMGDWAWSASQSNAAEIRRLRNEVEKLTRTVNDLLEALANDGIITVIGPDDSIEEYSEVELQESRLEEYMELEEIWQYHLGPHHCFYEESDDAGMAECPTKYYTDFNEFYAEERAL